MFVFFFFFLLLFVLHSFNVRHQYSVACVCVCVCVLAIDSSMRVSQVVKGEMSAKTTYQKSAKGPVSIAECAPDGKSVSMENTGRKVSADFFY